MLSKWKAGMEIIISTGNGSAMRRKGVNNSGLFILYNRYCKYIRLFIRPFYTF